MTNQINLQDNVLLVRLNGRIVPAELAQSIQSAIEASPIALIVILDFTLAIDPNQSIKAVLYRILQAPKVLKIGLCGMGEAMQADWNDLITLLGRVRPVSVGITDQEVRHKLGLIAISTEPKLRGMLAYLRKD
jgi:hypothetical protein